MNKWAVRKLQAPHCILNDTPSIQRSFLVLRYPKEIRHHIELFEQEAYLNLALRLVATLGPNIYLDARARLGVHTTSMSMHATVYIAISYISDASLS